MRRRPIRAGFTLLEIMVALAIAAMLLIALNGFIFGMGELWGRNSDRRLFNQHVNAVTRFLTEEFRIATFPPAARASSVPVAPMMVQPANGLTENLISFELPDGCRLLNWPGRPLPEVVCSLQVRQNDGLYLLWHSRLETDFATEPPRELKLTPFVTGIAYDYYDDASKRWTTQAFLQTDSGGNPVTPNQIELTFTYQKMSRTTIVPIPAALQGLPNF
jgi:prepilin-type N-terminal cleavage/methylation domain-containing protein